MIRQGGVSVGTAVGGTAVGGTTVGGTAVGGLTVGEGITAGPQAESRKRVQTTIENTVNILFFISSSPYHRLRVDNRNCK
jgi:hypothetical protein